ncbi:DUF305 domain-containing protein [Roseomonas nepalensis]|uniref:DUF305 domain-containing protein n=1 Tax=Muricoccus nepalensis TaxID=1854500 RepID=A0A502GBP1_9PROT|nr:DUF305 domain-containing protein [Roseomonas nepalensis]TPG58123.1 DUF305 domain-containing protein [Roseomonas nepalensis]
MASTIHQGRARRLAALTLALGAGLSLAAPPARALVGEGSDEGVQPVVSTSYTVVGRAGLEAALRADRGYVTGMRAHHAGALTMSDEYLADPAARSPALRALAVAIIHNQRFEIALLDGVARNLDRGGSTLGGVAVQPSASEGLAVGQRFARYPIPGPLTPFAAPGEAVTVRDVQFAKAMTIHHQGALDMAGAYQADPAGRNSFLRLLNVDIITDQTQEIALMRRVAAAYPGDAAAVPVPASMIHGMEGMAHGGHGAGPAAPAPDPHAGHGGAASPARAPAPAPSPASPRRAAPSGHRGHAH